MVVFEAWNSPKALIEHVSFCPQVGEYEPGQFYKRELPALLQALSEIARPRVLIIDAYCWLGERPGLGVHLHEATGLPVVGVAKNPFHSAGGRQVCRAGSLRPLYLTTCDYDLDEAEKGLLAMHGPFRVPDLLKRADRLSRMPSLAPS